MPSAAPSRNEDLHGMVPDKCEVALILLDVINDLEFPGGEELFQQSEPIYPRIAALRRRAREAGVPVIYVNDNFGQWRSDFRSLIHHCTRENVRGRPLVEQVLPAEDDYFVLKPKHSGFFSTTLDVLLAYLGVRSVIITGVAGNICVLFTANDAYMRDFRLYVPADCTASNSEEENALALGQMERVLKADTRPSVELDLAELRRKAREGDPEVPEQPDTPVLAEEKRV